ncbi:MAG: hypothetical protein ACYCPO_15090 [Acidobacteriaceae bacterium]
MHCILHSFPTGATLRLLSFEGTNHKTAWTLLHELRHAMVRQGRDRLSGRVEAEETYLGAARSQEFAGGGMGSKAPIAVAAEEEGLGIGRIPDGAACLRWRPARRGAAGAIHTPDYLPGPGGRCCHIHGPCGPRHSNWRSDKSNRSSDSGDARGEPTFQASTFNGCMCC